MESRMYKLRNEKFLVDMLIAVKMQSGRHPTTAANNNSTRLTQVTQKHSVTVVILHFSACRFVNPADFYILTLQAVDVLWRAVQ